MNEITLRLNGKGNAEQIALAMPVFAITRLIEQTQHDLPDILGRITLPELADMAFRAGLEVHPGFRHAVRHARQSAPSPHAGGRKG